MSQPPSPQGRPVVRLRLASPEDVARWSSGEVRQARTLHPRSGKPEPGGLFCEEIFGPLAEWRCRCGKLEGENYYVKLDSGGAEKDKPFAQHVLLVPKSRLEDTLKKKAELIEKKDTKK